MRKLTRALLGFAMYYWWPDLVASRDKREQTPLGLSMAIGLSWQLGWRLGRTLLSHISEQSTEELLAQSLDELPLTPSEHNDYNVKDVT